MDFVQVMKQIKYVCAQVFFHTITVAIAACLHDHPITIQAYFLPYL